MRHQVINIPISLRLPEDTLIWHWEKDGMYSVKTTYHLLCEDRFKQQPVPSSSSDKNLWKEIWDAALPNKIKNFLWRLAKNILPTRFNLANRGVKVEMLCPLCSQAVERVDHIFMQCHLGFPTKGFFRFYPTGLDLKDWVYHFGVQGLSQSQQIGTTRWGNQCFVSGGNGYRENFIYTNTAHY